MMRIAVIDQQTGQVLGEVSAPDNRFFFCGAFEEWRNLVVAEAVSKAIERCDKGCFYNSRFEIRVSRW